MNNKHVLSRLDDTGDVVRLAAQFVGRFYGDGNRLGQRSEHARQPRYYKPERWIGSSTQAANPPDIPSGGLSTCPDLTRGKISLKQLVADPQFGPRMLGQQRYMKHKGTFRVLVKLLDAQYPIPLHVHADDQYVQSHPESYPDEQFGKDEAYHFLDVAKGDCPYTHIGVFPGVTAKDLLAAMRRGSDHVVQLSPGAMQNFHEGFMVKGGLLHRPGTAVTLEIQQPSDVYTLFQTDFGGQALPDQVLHPGFASSEAAAEAVVDWHQNDTPGLLDAMRLHPSPVATPALNQGGRAEWVYPPQASDKFSGMRLTVETQMTFLFDQPCVLFVWRGQGTLDGQRIEGGGGETSTADEFFLGQRAVERGVVIANTGDQPLIGFALFAPVV